MADFMTPEQRSRAMSKVRSRDTGIEKTVRSSLHRKGFRFRNNVSNLPGRPDIVLPKYRFVIFIHGCFWHGHKNCKASKLPETRREFWQKKIKRNARRDDESRQKLEKSGWRVFFIWQCQLKNKILFEESLTRLIDQIKR